MEGNPELVYMDMTISACQRLTTLLIVIFSLFVGGCSLTPERDVTQSAEYFYQQGHRQLKDEDMSAAEATLDEMEARFPLHVRTHQLYLELADAYHWAGETEKAVQMADRFIRRFPDHRDVDYAYFVKGQAYFSKAVPALAPNNPKPDRSYADAAMESYIYLLRHYPQSSYRLHARENIAYLRALLAQYELGQVKELVAQGNRAKASELAENLVKLYPETPSATKAMALFASAPTTSESSVVEKEGAKEVSVEMVSPEPVAVMVEEAPVETSALEVPKPARSALDSDQWLRSRPPRHLTIQVAGNRKLSTLKEEMEQLGIADEVRYFERMLKGKPWYSAIYGEYAAWGEGSRALKALKTQLGKSDLWLRRFGDIQKSMR